MAREEIPAEVVRFIAEKIDTVPHLEALLLLWENAPKEWSPEDLSVRVYVSPAKSRAILQDLVRGKLAAHEAGSLDLYRYDGAWDVTGSLMNKVATTYRQQLVRIANFIHSKGSGAVRDFARAFEFKKER